MFFVLNDLKFKYELEKLCRLFLPFEKFVFIDEINDDFKSENLIITKIIDNDGKQLFTKLVLDGKVEVRENKLNSDNFTETEKTLALMLFDCFYKITEYRSPWGILTGVRPAKLMGKLINKDGVSSAIDYFKNSLLVNDVKTKLCLECYNSEKQIISRSKPDSFSLYISIPFCPSRCSYCSFVSHSVEQAKKTYT